MLLHQLQGALELPEHDPPHPLGLGVVVARHLGDDPLLARDAGLAFPDGVDGP